MDEEFSERCCERESWRGPIGKFIDWGALHNSRLGISSQLEAGNT